MEYHVNIDLFNNDFELKLIANKYCKDHNLTIISNVIVNDSDLKFIAAANREDVEDYDIRDIIRFLPISYIKFYLSNK